MTGRPNTLVCSFDPASPRITAWDIHEWIHEALQIPEQDVLLVQIDGLRRQVYIKLTTSEQVIAIIQKTNGSVDYNYPSGEIFRVTIDVAGLGTKRVRIANLPPEVPDDILRDTMKQYGKIISIRTETWSTTYRYKVSNGIRNVHIVMSRHIPPTLTVAGNKVLLSYDGQPFTCYTCGEEGHVASTCPQKRRPVTERRRTHPASYAGILASADPTDRLNESENITTETQQQTNTRNLDDRDEPHQSVDPFGSTDEHDRTPNDVIYIKPQIDTTQPAPPPMSEQTPDHEGSEADRMETEPWQTKTPETLKNAYSQGVLLERRHEKLQTPQREAHTDTDDLDTELSMDTHVMDEGLTTKHGKDVSPKRNKKMKTEKSVAKTQDRSRSGTRRALSKGKTQ